MLKCVAKLATTSIFAGLLLGMFPAAASTKPAAADAQDATVHFPPKRSIEQTVEVGGKSLHYRVTIQAIPVYSQDNKLEGQVVTIAYTVPGRGKRPVTFAFNGGPGSSSGFLDVGAIGPKRVQFGANGDSPSTSIVPSDNPNTWLDFTDLVFIDPIGTGFSRSELGPEATRKAFYGIKQDVSYLSRVVYDWLKLNHRMESRKYIAGESYGGFRVPRIARQLQVWGNVGPSGLILISPYLDGHLLSPTGEERPLSSPMAAIVDLPSMAAAHYEMQGLPLTPARMAPVEHYVEDVMPGQWMKGWSDPAAVAAMSRQIAEFTGLPVETVAQSGGRITQDEFLRALFRKPGLIASRYDINVRIPDPNPWAQNAVPTDPVAQSFTVVGSAMTNLITNTLGWPAEGKYYPFNPAVSQGWYQQGVNPESVSALRQAMSMDPKMKVLIANGYTDLSCPYFMSKLSVNQIAPTLAGNRLTRKVYPGGHMFYSRGTSSALFKKDVKKLFQ